MPEESAFASARQSCPSILMHVSKVQQYFSSAGADFDSQTLIDALGVAFSSIQQNGPLGSLSEQLTVPIEACQKMLVKVDPSNIVPRVLNSVAALDFKNLKFYVGAVSRDSVEPRFADHGRNKADIHGKVLAEYGNSSDGLIAESTGITLLKLLAKGEFAMKIKGTWNKSDGIDSASLLRGARTAQSIKVYLLWSTDNTVPFDYSVGSLQVPMKIERRDPSKWYCLNDGRNTFPTKAKLQSRNAILTRKNLQCSCCSNWFPTAEDLRMHQIAKQLKGILFKCKLCHLKVPVTGAISHLEGHGIKG